MKRIINRAEKGTQYQNLNIRHCKDLQIVSRGIQEFRPENLNGERRTPKQTVNY